MNARKMPCTLLAMVLTACAARLGGAERPASIPAAAKWRVEVRELGRAAKRYPSEFLVSSADGLHVAFRGLVEGDKKAMFHDGKLHEPFDGLGKPIFSPDGKRLAYVARRSKKVFVVLDGTPGPAFDTVHGNTIAFSPDCRRVAYLAKRGEQTLAVIDDRELAIPGGWNRDYYRPVFSPDCRRVAVRTSWYDSHRRATRARVFVDGEGGREFTSVARLRFSPDSKRFLYAAWPEDKKAQVIADGAPGAVFEEVEDESFTADSKHVVYRAKKGEKWHLVVDAEVGEGFDMVGLYRWSASTGGGDRLAYTARSGKTWHVWLDGKLSPPYSRVTHLCFSPDGRRVAYRADQGLREQFLVIDGEAGPTFNEIKVDGSVFSADSKRYAYRASKGFRWHAVIDGEVSRAYVGMTEIVFSPDGRRTAYAGGRKVGEVVVVVDGRTGEVWNGFDEDHICFSPDSKHVAYVAKKGRSWYAVVDGRRGEPCDRFPPIRYGYVFSATGGHFACVARKEKAVFVLLDGKPGPTFSGIVQEGPTFRDDGTLEYLAWQKGMLCRVRHVLPPAEP